jgi:hypothetical protein
MARWVLVCPKCETEFEHSQIGDAGVASFYEPTKPVFSPTDNKCVCLNCGHSATYLRTNLLYRV